jgi:hypothetical protein
LDLRGDVLSGAKFLPRGDDSRAATGIATEGGAEEEKRLPILAEIPGAICRFGRGESQIGAWMASALGELNMGSRSCSTEAETTSDGLSVLATGSAELRTPILTLEDCAVPALMMDSVAAGVSAEGAADGVDDAGITASVTTTASPGAIAGLFSTAVAATFIASAPTEAILADAGVATVFVI